MPYYFAPKATWSGSWAGSAAAAQSETTPTTAKQLADWLNSGAISAGSHIIFMGEYGPLTLTDTQDFAANAFALNAPIKRAGLDFAAASIGRSILFGDQSDAASSIDGCIFEARSGANTYNVDMRGATVNADRQMGAILFQGINLTIDGWKVRAADWNPINNTDRIRTSGAGGLAIADRPAEASEENFGMMVRGALGSRITNCEFDGGSYGRTGLTVDYRASNSTPTWAQNTTLEVDNNESWSWGEACIRVAFGSGINASVEGRNSYGIRIKVHDNVVRDALWGDPAYNAARRFGNLMAVTGLHMQGSDVEVYDNIFYGECQDMLFMGYVGGFVRYNEFRYALQGVTYGQTINTYEAVGANWQNSTMAAQGNGCKFGLTGYTGEALAGWLVGPRLVGGTSNVPTFGAAIIGNRFGTVSPISGYALSSNGGRSGVLIANEIDALGVAIALGGGSTGTLQRSQYWVAQNYVKSGSYGMQLGTHTSDATEIFAFNNIFDTSAGSLRIDSNTSGSAVYGARNFLRSAASISGTSPGSALWTNNYTGTPQYTVGVGPTAAGNCVGVGDPTGLTGVRYARIWRDVSRRYWRIGALPLGPYQP